MSTGWLIVTHTIAAVCGAGLGIYATQVLHDLDVIARKEPTVPKLDEPSKVRLPRLLSVVRRIREHVTLYDVLLFVIIVMLANTVYLQYEQQSCGKQVAASITERAADNKKLDSADARTEKAIIALGVPGNDKADFEELISSVTAKNIARQQRDQGQIDNPYPDPTSCS